MRKMLLLLAAAGVVAVTAVTLASASTNSGSQAKVSPVLEGTTGYLPLGQAPAGNDWAYPAGDASQTAFSTLKQINTGNVANLKMVWQKSFNGPSYASVIESNPLVVSGKGKNLPREAGTMFVSANKGVVALNPLDGSTLWSYVGPPPVNGAQSTSFGSSARAFSYGNGMIFTGQQDGSIAGLNAKTGAAIWTYNVSGAGVFAGHTSLTSPATLFFNDGKDGLVFGGPNFGDAPMRGHLDAINAKTGALVWRVWTTPDPGQMPYILTWANPAEAAVGGGATWSSYAADSQNRILYFGTGNVYPYTGRQPGKDLWSSSLMAVNISTGKLRWYYQTTHHDLWDYDVSNPPVLFNANIKGKVTPIVAVGSKLGYLFELNRLNGSPIFPIPEVPVPDLNGGKGAALNNTWPTQPIPSGGAGQITPHCLTKEWLATVLPATGGTTAPNGLPIVGTCPYAHPYSDKYVAWGSSNYGNINFPRSSYDPLTKNLYICAMNNTQAVANISPTDWHFQQISTGAGPTAGQSGTVTALNMETNTVTWQNVYQANRDGTCYSGVASTAGGLVFVASKGDNSRGVVNTLPKEAAPYGGYLYAYDARTGKTLWSYQAPDLVMSPPITYMAGGKQYVAWYLMGPVPTSPRADGKGRDLLTVFSL
jgi:glucose dehydrogenase